ncbi:hypothetical protein ACFUCQ_37595 [Streptomyces sp. NPDC057197]|uniref:hypothetical protein n=1 Tax=Streptomyces sp. NPDC057197 TaxID=3346045 RepID=UPI0036287EE8
MTSAATTSFGRAPVLCPKEEEGPGQTVPIAALLAQACRTVLDGQVHAVSAGLVSAARTLLTSDDNGRPHPTAQMATAAGPGPSVRHLALADLCGWPFYHVESARIVLHLTTPAPPGPDGILRSAIAATTTTATMTVTIRLSARPGPRRLADELVAAALIPAPPITDSDRLPSPAGRAVAAWRHLPSLYRGAQRLSAEAPGHLALRAVEELAEAVCRWCAGGSPVEAQLIAGAPHPETLEPNAPPALITLAATVSELQRALSVTDHL